MPKREKETDKPRIIYSCYSHLNREGEQFIPNHIFGYVLSGVSEIYVGNKNYTFNPGDFRFLRKNQLARFVKHPPKDGEFKAISVAIDQNTLIALSNELGIHAEKPYAGESALYLPSNPLFTNYVNSLAPYRDNDHQVSAALTGLKVKEAVMILLETNPELSDVLFDFSEPGKIDLKAFMAANYKFNVDINRFAYLTGRSLATFKRDFERIFNTSPSRWLQQQRLNDAYYLIKEKKTNVTDVYMDVGFKDLSHFSFAFKKAFGVAPSKLT